MNATQYLTFIPLLFYGIALAELVGQWKRFFYKEPIYWPYLLTTIMFTELAIWNVFIYLDILGEMTDVTYLKYWSYLLQPVLFLITVNALIIERGDKELEAFFKQRMQAVFGIMAIFVALHFLPGLGGEQGLNVARLLAVLLSLGIAISRKVLLVYLTFILWLISIFLR